MDGWRQRGRIRRGPTVWEVLTEEEEEEEGKERLEKEHVNKTLRELEDRQIRGGERLVGQQRKLFFPFSRDKK